MQAGDGSNDVGYVLLEFVRNTSKILVNSDRCDI